MIEETGLSDTARSFISGHILPFRKYFENQDLLDITLELIRLLDKHWDCPSVVAHKGDPEQAYSRKVRNRLVHIPLKEHSYRVAVNMVEAVTEKYKIFFYENHIPMAVIAGLAHDIGKIPVVRSESSCSDSEHQILSARWLFLKFVGKDRYFADKVIKAVENHHLYSEDEFTRMLKEADRKARQAEIMKLVQVRKISPLKEWFRIDGFYKRMQPHINFAKGLNNWKAFTYRGILYCRPQFIYETTRAMCEDFCVPDLLLLDDTVYDEALFKIVKHLREHGFISDQLGPDSSAERYVIYTHVGMKYKIILTPLKPAAFYAMKELEARKIGFFEIIKGVSPG